MKKTRSFHPAALTVPALLAALALHVFIGSLLLPLSAKADEEPRTANAKQQDDPDAFDTYKQLNLFGDVFERVRAQYVEDVSDEEIVESAIRGMLANLDPHSAYLDEDDFKDMQIQTRGKFGGLGIEVTMENGFVKVVSPIDDTPAFRAGVQAGDYITHLDDEPVLGLSLNEAVDKMRGDVGTTIKLSIRRKSEDEPVEITITRDIIQIRSVRHRVEGKNIGYIRITTFNQNAEKSLEKAVKEISEELGNDLAGYILDLRNNPGGLLDQAIAVSDAFLEKGEIVSTRGRNEQDTKRDNATAGDITGGKPVVVLINGGSASASEIVAGALQDHRRAILLGTDSFGKGSVQTVIPLPGHGAMRLTTARYYTPSGRSIQAEGIEPDIFVEQARLEKFSDEERTRERNLRGALQNEEDENGKDAEKDGKKRKGKDKRPKDKDRKDKGDKDDGDDPEDGAQSSSDQIEDYQLARAIDLLHGLTLYQERLGLSGE